jgi:HlyD family secretion protein
MKWFKSKKKLIGIIALVVIVSVVGFLLKNKTTALEVEVSPVAEGNIEEYVEELDDVKVKQNETIHANLQGKVTEVLVEEGDTVKQGDILVRLDSEDQARDIEMLEAQRSALNAQYKEAVKSADAKEIKKLELSLNDLEKTFEESTKDLANKKELLDEGIISEEEYQDSVLAYELEQTEIEKLKIDLELLKKPVSTNIVRQYEAQLLQIDLQIEALKSNEGDFVFSAPFDGTILTKNISKGSYVQPGMAIIEIGNLNELYVESDVLVEDIVGIQEGTRVSMENDDLAILDLKGEVTKIYPQAFSKVSDLGVEQKRIKVEIQISQQETNLKPGYDLDVRFITNQSENALIIPENALFQMEGEDYVFIIDKNVATLRQVKKGIESDKYVEIISGLNQEDKVILSPDDSLEEGMLVKERSFDN